MYARSPFESHSAAFFRSISARSLYRLNPFPHFEKLKGSSKQTQHRLHSVAIQGTRIGRHLSGLLLSYILYFHACCSLGLSQHLSDADLTCRGPKWQEIERNYFPLGQSPLHLSFHIVVCLEKLLMQRSIFPPRKWFISTQELLQNIFLFFFYPTPAAQLAAEGTGWMTGTCVRWKENYVPFIFKNTGFFPFWFYRSEPLEILLI